MNESLKVQPHHLERGAYLYIRQSSMRQVIENVESTKRQYALRGRAVALGWREDQIIVIDSDQGESGASASWRGGFQRLVTDVGMAHAGIVMGLEVSRLARNNADWHRLLEICALADTLILDEDGVYDPASFNDRLLLGLKGTTSEAELHVIKARLRGGILNKVRRGEYRCVLPTGFVYDEAGNVVLDPDSQIRETIAYFFETFSRVASARQTVKVFRNKGLLFPSRLRNSAMTIFRPLTASTAIRTLNNPRYAGAYAYGRRHYRRADARFTALRVAYLAHEYGLRSRYDRLRDRGMLTREEAAARLGICESTLIRWVEHGLVARHAYNAHAYLYEAPGPNPPVKHCSRWDRLIDRAAATQTAMTPKSSLQMEGDAV